MKDEIFSVKLSQLDDRIGKLHSRIHMSEAASHNQLQREIHDLTRECIQEEWKLREHMRRSKSGLVSVLSGFGKGS